MSSERVGRIHSSFLFCTLLLILHIIALQHNIVSVLNVLRGLVGKNGQGNPHWILHHKQPESATKQTMNQDTPPYFYIYDTPAMMATTRLDPHRFLVLATIGRSQPSS